MMHYKSGDLIEVLTLIHPDTLIPVIEKGLEIERLELLTQPESEELKESIHYSTIVLTFLRCRRLGL